MNTFLEVKTLKRALEYLTSECSDFDLTYKWEWNEDTRCCEVEVKKERPHAIHKILKL